jgi:ribosome-associated translation inhibitor RaiA
VDVEVIHEANPRQAESAERVEITVRGKGPVLRAEAAAGDRYSAFDLALSKLLEQARRVHDRRKSHHKAGRRAFEAAALPAIDLPESTPVAPIPPQRLAQPADWTSNLDLSDRPVEAADAVVTKVDSRTSEIKLGDSPIVIREKLHTAVPMSVEDAIYEMEMVGHPFFLFVDSDCGLPSVLYHRRGWTYGVIRLESVAAAPAE